MTKTVHFTAQEVRRGERAARLTGTTFHAFARQAIIAAAEAALADKAA